MFNKLIGFVTFYRIQRNSSSDVQNEITAAERKRFLFYQDSLLRLGLVKPRITTPACIGHAKPGIRDLEAVASAGFVARRGKDSNYAMGHSRWTSGPVCAAADRKSCELLTSASADLADYTILG